MIKKQTAEEFCKNYTRLRSAMAIQDLTECMNEYAKLHVKAALEAAAENAELKEQYPLIVLDKDSIIDAYPLNLIV